VFIFTIENFMVILSFGQPTTKDYNLSINSTTVKAASGSSINDVTVLGGRGYQGFCDNSTKASVIKSVTMGEGSRKMS
jgi:hypothetical protein